MNRRDILATAFVSVVLTACGGDGGEFEQAVNVGGPQVRLVNANPQSPLLRVYRKGEEQTGAGVQGYEGASKYFDSIAVTSDWTVRDAGTGDQLGTTTMRVENATRYTLVALPGADGAVDLLQISDPFSNALTDNARVRFVNGDLQLGGFDAYITPVGADFTSKGPNVADVETASVRPVSGDNSYSLPSGTYQLRLTTAGSTSVFFRATFILNDHDDLLLVTLPTSEGTDTKILQVPSNPSDNNLEIFNDISGDRRRIARQGD